MTEVHMGRKRRITMSLKWIR